jgi:hypothetical protein
MAPTVSRNVWTRSVTAMMIFWQREETIAPSHSIGAQNFLDSISRGVSLEEVRQNDASAVRFDDVASAHIVRPIVSLDENMRQDRLDELPRLIFVEDDNTIDSAQCRKHGCAIAFGVDRPSRSLDAEHGRVAVEADNQGITLRPRKFEILDVAAMQDVKTAVRKDELSSGGIEPITQSSSIRNGKDLRIHKHALT